MQVGTIDFALLNAKAHECHENYLELLKKLSLIYGPERMKSFGFLAYASELNNCIDKIDEFDGQLQTNAAVRPGK